MSENKRDLRNLLLRLYLKNNPQLEHSIFIYSFHGIVDVATNPFHFVGGKLPENVKKSIVLQNLPLGEMMQAFISPVKNPESKTIFQIENTVLYGNKTGALAEIHLNSANIEKSEKYRQFLILAQSLLSQFN